MVAFCAGNNKQQAIHVAVARRFLFVVAFPNSASEKLEITELIIER